jgi:RNA polymerase sigma-70 factor (ECF subfamily)
MSWGHERGGGAAMSDQFDGLDRLIAGEKAAWDRFVVRFAPVIFAAVRRKLVPAGRVEDAEDVAQDVFIRLCARDFHVIRRYDPARAKLTTWLTVIAHSAAIDHLRRQKARAQPLDTVPEAYLAVDPPKDPVTIDIPPGLLSPRQALVLEMLYQRDMDVAEAAQVLGVAAQTVRSTHHKALIKLRAHFKEPED